jgi:rhodanese-related sulfurtransferase
MGLNIRVPPFDVPSVTVDDVPPDAFLLDVREADEWAAGHIDGARHIPMRQIPAAYAGDGPRPPDGPIVVVCAVGGRSGQVTAWFNQNGIDAVNLVGGMHAWAQAGRGMVSETGAPAVVL